MLQATNVLKVSQDFDMKTYNACRERAEDQAATKIQTEAMTQARWEQIYALAGKMEP